MTKATIQSVIARWDSGEGKPYKGSLIDYEAWEADPSNIGCMCAQGQALHLLAGWEPKRLADTRQSIADRETASLLNISLAHAILLRDVNDKQDGAPSIVLTDPAKVLGDQWSKLFDFWWAYDQFVAGDWRKVVAARGAAWDAAGVAAGVAAGDAAWGAARDAAGVAAGVAARDAAGDAAWGAAWDAAGVAAGGAAWDAAGVAAGGAARDAAWGAAGVAAGVAAWEIQGFEILTSSGRECFFLPMFGWKTPADIPARPEGYGLGVVPTMETSNAK